jgi:hypothetical protein
MPQYLSVYTPAKSATQSPPTAEHMAAMGKLIERGFKEGWLIATGGTTKSEIGGFRFKMENGKHTVEKWPFASDKLQKVAGFAVMKANSYEELERLSKEFLTLAGDGESEVIQLLDMPPPG